MLEVVLAHDGWRWTWLSAAGRPLVHGPHPFPEQRHAFEAARAYRTTFWRIADRTDHRMGRNI